MMGAEIIHKALRIVAANSEGAIAAAGMGFLRDDLHFGRRLAQQTELTEIQLRPAAKMALRHLDQIPPNIKTQVVEAAKSITAESVSTKTPPRSDEPFDPDKIAWGPEKRIVIKGRDRIVQEWTVTGHAFWIEWKKGDLRQKGYRLINAGKSQYRLQKWTIPLELNDSIAAARQAQEDRALFEWVPELRAELQARFEDIAGKIYDYQQPSVKRLIATLDAHGGALDASDTGTGKTYSAIAAVTALGMKAFIICPKAVKPSWRAAARHFDVRLIDAIGYEKLRTGNTEYATMERTNTGKVDKKGKCVYRLDRYVFNERFLPKERVALVFDEMHRCKMHSTQNAIMMISAIVQGYKVLGLSATAADNPTQMKCIALLTQMIQTPESFWGWLHNHGGKGSTHGFKFSGKQSILHDIHRHIFPKHGTRIRIADLGDKFPETQIMAEAFDFDDATAEIKAIYQEMYAEIAKLEAKEKKDPAAILVQQLRARQRVELLKVPTMCSMVNDAVEEGMSVAVILNFEDSLQAFAQRLKTKCIIHGGQKDDERERNIQDFQRDSESVILLNIRAGGVGVSLHGGTPTSRVRLSLISPTFSGQDLKQAVGRVHRANGAKSLQKIVFAAGTIEEEACEKVKEKLIRIATINDGELAEALTF